jgi:hypothetical protein
MIQDFITMCRHMNVTLRMAKHKTSKLDGRITRHIGYHTSQQIRKRVEDDIWLGENSRRRSETKIQGYGTYVSGGN